ncbi:hypothetical protein F5Y16DRAFT_423714 [Xylariaceae sp. FL0255]|nr:hypothetical protein F5Y16DRAFT_423714 [Xylariaceae sp. FL0255]
MSPRKRVRPNPSGETATSQPETESSATSQLPLSSQASAEIDPSGMPPTTNTSTPTLNAKDKKVRNSKSWYGSWPRVPKTSASTSVARETANGGTTRPGTAADFTRFETNKSGSTLIDSDTQSTASLPKITESDVPQLQGDPVSSRLPPTLSKQDYGADDPQISAETNPPTTNPQQIEAPPNSGRWLPWLARSAPQGQLPAEENKIVKETPKAEVTRDSPKQPGSDVPAPARPSSSWFGLWPTAAPAATQSTNQDTSPAQPVPKPDEDFVMNDDVSPPQPPAAPSHAQQPSAGSTWAFWSRDAKQRESVGATPPEQGELAVMGDISETSPAVDVEIDKNISPTQASDEPAKDGLANGTTKKKSKQEVKRDKKRERPQSVNFNETVINDSSAPQSEATNLPTKTANSILGKQMPPNLLLPSFRNTYRLKENPSIIKQITQLLLRTQQPAAKHVYLSTETPKVKKAVAIGVHGLFPASFLRPMIGQPTGTSLRFASHCADAIRRWADSHGYGDCEIEKIALEGEGKIADRVNNLWKLLLNWIEHLRSADLILIACHSQGVPVSVMLLAKLIELGVVNSARIGVCAMAGVSLGPFPDYNGMGIVMGSAAELWQLGDPESVISKRYEQSLQTVINNGARISYVGSIDDQLVPLESALFGPASHPYIYRAVFIDGRIHAPDFIAHLIGFALKLRNLGISDHGLIRELSVALAGSLYSGEGHSRLYDDEQVYDLAMSHTLETTNVSETPCHIQKHEGLNNSNPYILPWIMRGLLEEDFVKTELYSETVELLKQFEEWTPSTKALKDVKYRLEAVRSKL